MLPLILIPWSREFFVARPFSSRAAGGLQRSAGKVEANNEAIYAQVGIVLVLSRVKENLRLGIALVLLRMKKDPLLSGLSP